MIATLVLALVNDKWNITRLRFSWSITGTYSEPNQTSMIGRLLEKCPFHGIFLVRIFPRSDCIRRATEWTFFKNRSSRSEVFCKKGVLKNFAKFAGKHLRLSLFFNKETYFMYFVKKETLAQMFSCEAAASE